MSHPASEAIPVVSHCPLQATSFVWRASGGRRALTVVCKATYELCPGVSPLAEDQDDVHTDDVHWEGSEQNSLKAPSDLVPFKPRVDVLVTGHAHAPRGQTVRSLFARVVAGAVNKTIAVYGDRRFLPGGELSQPAELERVPLCWERAAGGPGTANPAGVAADPYGAEPAAWAPNFQPPGIYVASAMDPIPPAGMGPLAPDWPDRWQKCGRAAASWNPRRWYAEPLPEGMDAAYFNSAPPDQQVDHVASDERIVLENLHPEHPRLVTQLDGVIPRATLRSPGRPDGSIDLRCDTLWIDTDRGVCCATWRGTVAYEMAEGAEIHITADGGLTAAPSPAESTVWAAPGSAALLPFSAPETPAWADPGSTAPLHTSVTETTVWVDESRLAGALRRAEPPFPPAGPPAPPPEPDAAETTLALVPRAISAETATLPFAPGAPGVPVHLPPAADSRERAASRLDATATILAPLAPATPELPHGWSGARPPGPPDPVAAPHPPIPPAPMVPPPPVLTAPIAAPPPPFAPPIVAPPPLVSAPAAAPPPVFAAPVPPPLMGPIAQGAEPAVESEALTERPPPPGAPAPIPAVPGPPSLPGAAHLAAAPSPGKSPVEAPIDPEVFTIERWAELAAELDKAQRPRADILRDHDMNDHDLAAADHHWKGALAREATTGGSSLRSRHDAAYVGALERLRGRPIVAAEYAQIISAGDHRRVAAVLQGLEMPAAAHLPIARLWTAKLACDARLSLEMIQAVAALREGAGGAQATS